jgi:hypothetical protein
MAKVSIGLRGWRFDEDEVFDAEGNVRPLAEMDDDTVYRLVRLSAILGEPCDACWLEEGDVEACNPAAIVYGEPLHEVVLCGKHEADFLYWFREEGGEEYAGSEELQDAFHEWFVDGNRAPEGYGGLDHIEQNPEELPEPPTEPQQCGLDGVDEQVEEMSEAEQEALDLDTDVFDV